MCAKSARERHRYYRPDRYVWKGRFPRERGTYRGSPRLFRELRAVRVIAPTVVLVDIRTNDLGNGCVPEDLAERIVAFARELLTIPSVSQAVVCEILTPTPVECGRFEVRPDFDSARQVVKKRHGVHMSAVGMPRYVSSIRSAAVAAAKQC